MGNLKEIRLKVAKLQMETKELKRMKSDCTHMKKFRKLIVREKFD